MFISCGSDQFRIDTDRISGQIKLLYRYTVTAGLLLSIAMNHIKRVVCLISELALRRFLLFDRIKQRLRNVLLIHDRIRKIFYLLRLLLPHGTAAEQA